MSQEAVECFIGRIITDKNFRQKAVVSLEQACISVGLTILPREMVNLKSLNFTLFGQMAETLDDAIRRS